MTNETPVTHVTLDYASSRKSGRWGLLLLSTALIVAALPAAAAVKTFIASQTIVVNDSKPGLMKSYVTELRSAIDDYRVDHGGAPPSPTSIWYQLTNRTDLSGHVNADDTKNVYGPYVQPGVIAVNPVNRQPHFGSAPSRTVGWVYGVSGSTYTLQPVNTNGDGVLTY